MGGNGNGRRRFFSKRKKFNVEKFYDEEAAKRIDRLLHTEDRRIVFRLQFEDGLVDETLALVKRHLLATFHLYVSVLVKVCQCATYQNYVVLILEVVVKNEFFSLLRNYLSLMLFEAKISLDWDTFLNELFIVIEQLMNTFPDQISKEFVSTHSILMETLRAAWASKLLSNYVHLFKEFNDINKLAVGNLPQLAETGLDLVDEQKKAAENETQLAGTCENPVDEQKKAAENEAQLDGTGENPVDEQKKATEIESQLAGPGQNLLDEHEKAAENESQLAESGQNLVEEEKKAAEDELQLAGPGQNLLVEQKKAAENESKITGTSEDPLNEQGQAADNSLQLAESVQNVANQQEQEPDNSSELAKPDQEPKNEQKQTADNLQQPAEPDQASINKQERTADKSVQVDEPSLDEIEVTDDDLLQLAGPIRPLVNRLQPQKLSPNDFRNTSIVLRSDDLHETKKPTLRTNNHVQGGYESAERYLETQFRQLREDFLTPLKDGILEYKRHYARDQTENIKLKDLNVYTNVNMSRIEGVSTVGIVHRLKFSLKILRFVNWEKDDSSPGKLVCVSPDHFETFALAVTVESDPEYDKGHLYVKFFEQTAWDTDFHKTFVILEMPSYFDDHRSLLQGLIRIQEDDVPFANNLVKAEVDINPPTYMTKNTICNLRRFKITGDKMLSNPMSESWPDAAAMKLDESQHRALRAVLSREVAIIQGGPGTGKSFLCLKIVDVLMTNKRIWTRDKQPSQKGSILVMFRTDHALNKFVDEVRWFVFNGVVRMGENPAPNGLNKYSIERLIQERTPQFFQKIIESTNKEVRTLEKRITTCTLQIKHKKNAIVASDVFCDHGVISREHYRQVTNRLIVWLDLYILLIAGINDDVDDETLQLRKNTATGYCTEIDEESDCPIQIVRQRKLPVVVADNTDLDEESDCAIERLRRKKVPDVVADSTELDDDDEDDTTPTQQLQSNVPGAKRAQLSGVLYHRTDVVDDAKPKEGARRVPGEVSSSSGKVDKDVATTKQRRAINTVIDGTGKDDGTLKQFKQSNKKPHAVVNNTKIDDVDDAVQGILLDAVANHTEIDDENDTTKQCNVLDDAVNAAQQKLENVLDTVSNLTEKNDVDNNAAQQIKVPDAVVNGAENVGDVVDTTQQVQQMDVPDAATNDTKLQDVTDDTTQQSNSLLVANGTEVVVATAAIQRLLNETSNCNDKVDKDTNEVNKGSDEIGKSSGEANKGIEDVSKGTDEANKGTDDVSKDTDEVNKGFDDVNKGTNEVNKGSDDVNNGTDEVGKGSVEARKETDQVGKGTDEIVNAANATRQRKVCFSISNTEEVDGIRIIKRMIKRAKREEWMAANNKVPDVESEAGQPNVKRETQNQDIHRRLNVLRSEIKSLDHMSEEEANAVSDIFALDNNNRWRLYRYWNTKLIEKLQTVAASLRKKYEFKCEKLKVINEFVVHGILDEAKVIAATAKSVAKYRDALQKAPSHIVIVEEAAEIPESQVIAVLSKRCRHLVLIGDQQQLRPNPTFFKLGRNPKLDSSLFERLINNGLPYEKLQIQHRMRPDLASLFVPSICEKLDTDPPIYGMSKNVFFLDHRYGETPVGDDKMTGLIYEAQIAVMLCRYLALRGYHPQNVKILSSSSSQPDRIKQLAANTKIRKFRCFEVDEHQRLQTDIIILLLTGISDLPGVGCLSAENRLHVALSRAKKGLYCIGNSELLASKVPFMVPVLGKLSRAKLIGTDFPFLCFDHPDLVPKIENLSATDEVPDCAFTLFCEYQMANGRICNKRCVAAHKKLNEGDLNIQNAPCLTVPCRCLPYYERADWLRQGRLYQ